jgi:16S rRNA (guanine1516-N2)-methyltransferase
MNAIPKIVIISQTPEKNAEAEQLAQQLQLTYIEKADASHYPWALIQQPDRVALRFPGARQPFSVDFLQGTYARRLLRVTTREPLARAFDLKDALKQGRRPKIIDGTAGWGSDAMLLAKLGAEVVAIERSPIVACLLQDGVQRAQQSGSLGKLDIQVLNHDSCNYLQSLDDSSALIYLDPMFPKSPNSALVKKPLQLLQMLLGEPQDENQLVTIALTKATRVVVKRPSWAEPLIRTPNFSIPAGVVRFDVYL